MEGVGGHSFLFFELSVLWAKNGLYIPMCHVASARRMALKPGLELCGGGGGFQAPGPGVVEEGRGSRKGKWTGKSGGVDERGARGLVRVADFTRVVRRAPSLPSLAAVLLVWARALKGQLSQETAADKELLP